MEYNIRDIYPAFVGSETSTKAIPTPEEQGALHEDVKTARETKPNYTSGRNIVIGVGVLICLVVFLGGE